MSLKELSFATIFWTAYYFFKAQPYTYSQKYTADSANTCKKEGTIINSLVEDMIIHSLAEDTTIYSLAKDIQTNI